ncbi:MAG: hypothetical protein H6707_15825 [Deltaproteobacteria bacterium]|nr:hypothetical protein [Deltaproteobacteria bacterium]
MNSARRSFAPSRVGFFRPALLALLLGVGVLGATTEAQAQYYGGGGRYYGPRTTPRWGFRHRVHGYLGGQLGGFFVAAQVTDYDRGYMSHGGGGGLYGGVRLGPFVSMELNWGVSYHDRNDYWATYFDAMYMMTVTADLKLHVPTRGPVEPFFQGGLGFAWIGPTYVDAWHDTVDVWAKGFTFRLGGGLEFFAGPWLSVGGRLLYQGLVFTNDGFTGAPINKEKNFVNGVSLDFFGTIHF